MHELRDRLNELLKKIPNGIGWLTVKNHLKRFLKY